MARYVEFSSGDGKALINVDEIVMAIANGKHTAITLTNGHHYLIREEYARVKQVLQDK